MAQKSSPFSPTPLLVFLTWFLVSLTMTRLLVAPMRLLVSLTTMTVSLPVGVLDRSALNQLVNLYCVFPVLDGDAKRHKVYTCSGNEHPTSSLRGRSCIPCTEVLVVGGYKQGKRGGLVPGLFVVWHGLLEMLISSHGGARMFIRAFVREFVA